MLYWIIGILLCFCIVFAIILVSRVRITMKYIHQGKKDTFLVQAQFLKGLFDYAWVIPLNKIERGKDGLMHMEYETEKEIANQKQKDEKESTFEAESLIDRAREIRELLDSVYQLSRIVRGFLKKMTVEEFEWVSTIGTGDAASTGIFAGLLWTIKGSVAGFISFTTNMIKPPVLEVTPSFQTPVVQTELFCMFSFRIGQAMLAAYLIVKNWKGRKQHVRTSNSGLDADSNGKY
ncbi:DUF2953 domain-containing protein [Pseudalkalibacillus salsuginis]|uniref:DUF2953 domain-containing protein n=1 Tax=Pseudalkalibacillus salsuginis TaxID=2910972 RepID=UPI001F39FC06|nr:DUF2953 domain-containing protein [Pseudalkalibacillus salsuginis]MCF6408774.1 DUF2953 domain-containing protein [Pseudalkalibacillus salsuginis]